MLSYGQLLTYWVISPSKTVILTDAGDGGRSGEGDGVKAGITRLAVLNMSLVWVHRRPKAL